MTFDDRSQKIHETSNVIFGITLSFYKTGPCKEFQNGACNYGNFVDVEGGHPTNWCGKIHLPLPQRL